MEDFDKIQSKQLVRITGKIYHSVTYMQCLIGVRDEGDEDREDHIDEQRDEDVEIDLGEYPGRFRHM